MDSPNELEQVCRELNSEYGFNGTEIKRRKSKVMTLKKMIQHIRDGFGQGHGRNYLPWITIHRKNSSSNSNQVVSWMPPLGRTGHYLSRGEYFLALLLLWLGVLDLREQYPIWPFTHMNPLVGAMGSEGMELKWSRGLLEIAADANIRHGVEFGTNIPYVATIDQLATISTANGLKLVAFSSKPIATHSEEVNERTLERLELERLYFEEIGVRYVVTYSGLVPSILAGQLEWLLDCSVLPASPKLGHLVDLFATHFANYPDFSIAGAVLKISTKLFIPLDSAWILFRYCAWTQKIDIDLSARIITSMPAKRGGIALRSKLRQELFGEDWQ
jgi:hypothetical protein